MKVFQNIETLPVRAKVVPSEHNIFTLFPKDRNCDICLRTRITRASCRRRTGAVVPRAENVGYLITTDHKVLSESCESRNNHRCATVVQDLATQWIQAYPCKNKTSQETQRSLQKFLEPDRKTTVIYTDNSVEFGKACEELTWNHRTSTPHRSETNGIAERAVRRIKEGTSAVLLQSGLDEKWWADSMECYCCHYNCVHTLIAMLEAMKIPDAEAAVEKMREIGENTVMAADESQKTQVRRSLKQGLRAILFILRR